MLETEYLAELKRRRAITQSWTWLIAQPFWKLEKWIRKGVGKELPRPPAPTDDRAPASGMGRLAARALAPAMGLARVLGLARPAKFAGCPPRSEEVYADLQRERARLAPPTEV